MKADIRPSIVVAAMYRPTQLEEVVERLGQLDYPKILCVDKYSGDDGEKHALNSQVMAYAETLRDAGWSVYIHPESLGCRKAIEFAVICGVSESNHAIVIEDDLLFDENVTDFFLDAFAYAKTKQIEDFFVNGTNFSSTCHEHYTRFFHGWGWGVPRLTWLNYLQRRKSYHWDLRDLRTSSYKDHTIKELCVLESMGKLARLSNLPRDEGGIDTWDYQFAYHCLLNGIRGLTPSESLFENRGFDRLATHTRDGSSPQPQYHTYVPPLANLELDEDLNDFAEFLSNKKCRLCSENVEFMFKIDSDLGFPLIFSRCNSCALVQVVDVNWIDDAYHAELDQFDQGAVIRSLNMASFAANIIDAINWGAPVRGGLSRVSVIDYGAGSGLLARLLRDLDIDCWSYDKYQPAPLNPGFHISNLSGRRFDVLLLIEVIEHISDFRSFLRDMKDLDPDLVVISTELYSSQDSSWDYFAPFHGQHISVFTESTVRYLANNLDFQIYMLSSGLHVLGKRSLSFNRVDNLFGLDFLFGKLSENSFKFATKDQKIVRERKKYD